MGPDRAVDLLYAGMSVSVIAMIWFPASPVGTWVQIVAFGVLSIVIAGYANAKAVSLGARVDLGVHLLLAGAIVWMLAGMSHMMDGLAVSGARGGDMLTWLMVLTWALVVVCVIVMSWLAYRFYHERRHRSHVMCHIGVALGTGVTLTLLVS